MNTYASSSYRIDHNARASRQNADILILIDLQQGAHNFARTVVASELGAAQMPGPGDYGQG